MTLLFLHAAATLYMAGLIWFVQLVHYPLMAKVGQAQSQDFQREHQRRTSWAVGPAMLVELVAALWLVIDTPAGVATWLARLGLALVAMLWLSTALIQVPCHRRLESGFDSDTHRRLVNTNWLRTALWSSRGAIALIMLG